MYNCTGNNIQFLKQMTFPESSHLFFGLPATCCAMMVNGHLLGMRGMTMYWSHEGVSI